MWSGWKGLFLTRDVAPQVMEAPYEWNILGVGHFVPLPCSGHFILDIFKLQKMSRKERAKIHTFSLQKH